MNRGRALGAVGGALLLTVPWVVVLAVGAHLSTGPTVLLSGLAVLGSSFLLAWAAETAEEDVPRSFAIAVLAVLAVAPEYAVDALYAFNAGAGGATAEACARFTPAEIAAEGTRLARACHEANLAVANMTGANRILIGLGWSGIALFTIWRSFRAPDASVHQRDGLLTDVVTLDRGIAVEIAFLAVATLWAFLVPFGGGIDVLDTAVLVGLYVAYIVIILRAGVESQEEHIGVPKYLQSFPRGSRVLTVITLFVYSGAMILLAVEEFAHGLEALGIAYGLPSFFMIQWIAPLASESPELIVVVVLVLKSRSTAGFNALISSKLNQWTLLIGTLVVVYSLALGQYGTLPFDFKQRLEIWITAAQSFFALAILANFEISAREALALLVLFLSQVVFEFLVLRVAVLADLLLGVLPAAGPEELSHWTLVAYTVVYIVLGVALIVKRRDHVAELVSLTQATARRAVDGEPAPEVD
jgi:cation:H+ antiporter